MSISTKLDLDSQLRSLQLEPCPCPTLTYQVQTLLDGVVDYLPSPKCVTNKALDQSDGEKEDPDLG